MLEGREKGPIEINYEKAAAEAINRVKQELATKESERRLKQAIERQKMNETFWMPRPEPETAHAQAGRSNCNTLKMVTGNPSVSQRLGQGLCP